MAVAGPREIADELARRTEELRRAEARFRDIIEHNADAIVVVDHDGVVCFANAAATRLFGMPREALVGSNFGLPLTTGETTEVDLLAGGAPRVAEMRIVDSEWDERPARIASLRDITERRHAEQAARELIREQAARLAAEQAARRLRFLGDSTAVLVASLDDGATLASLASLTRLCAAEIADWAVVYDVNGDGRPRRLEVAHADPARAASASALRAMAIAPREPHPILELLRTGEPRLVRDVTPDALAAMGHDAHERTIILELGIRSFIQAPMVARDRVIGALTLVRARENFTLDDLALARDVAARAALAIDNARLYHDAQEANQSKTDLLAAVSHDLRTPLNAILGYSDLLEMGIPRPLPPESAAHVQRIRTSSKHLLYLMNELLTFARLDSGREQARIVEADLPAVIRDCATVIEPLARERGLTFHVALPAAPMVRPTDPDKLRQIVLNLAGNAVRYTDVGEVRLCLREECTGHAAIEVSDTGHGIAAAHLPRIFEPFWQANPEQRARRGGTGLGLSVVHRLVELLGGSIAVESELGAGSRFTVTFPHVAK